MKVLKYDFTNSGFCQAHYFRMVGRKKKWYCLQEDREGFRLMSCTQDGEPSHEAGPLKEFAIERGADADEPYLHRVNDWLDKKEVAP